MGNSGYISWPTHLYSYGGNGVYVYLVVARDDVSGFDNCWPIHSVMPISDVIDPDPEVGKIEEGTTRQIFPLEEKWWPRYHESQRTKENDYNSVPLMACICLGTSSGSWSTIYHEKPDLDPGNLKVTKYGQWYCCYEDLTEEGKNVYDYIKKLYGIEPTLLTFLDT